MASFSSLVCDGSWSGAIKLLDKGLAEAKAGGGDGEVEYSLLMNRAFCNQRLKLHRKALKLWSLRRLAARAGVCSLRSDSGKMGSGQVGVVNFRLETSMYRSSGIVLSIFYAHDVDFNWSRKYSAAQCVGSSLSQSVFCVHYQSHHRRTAGFQILPSNLGSGSPLLPFATNYHRIARRNLFCRGDRPP
eukprot:gene29969-18035_t